MRRNSSFFWASDAMRNLDTDDDDFDDDADDDAVGRSSDELQPKQRLAPIVSQGTEDDNSTQEGLVLDDQLPAPLETFAADEESHPLILRTQEGDSGGGGGDYGSNSTSRQGVDVTIKGHQPQRRFMFTHRESHQSPHSFTDSWSKSPRQSLTLQQSMQPLVLRLQVV